MAQIRVPTMLRPIVGGERSLTAAGTTLRELLQNVDAKHPGFSGNLLDASTGELRRFVNVYVNDEDVRFLQGLDTPLGEQDAIAILPAVAGGR